MRAEKETILNHREYHREIEAMASITGDVVRAFIKKYQGRKHKIGSGRNLSGKTQYFRSVANEKYPLPIRKGALKYPRKQRAC